MQTTVALPRRRFVLGMIGSVLAGPALVRAGGALAAPAPRAAASLGPLINIPQTYNNCGPAAIAEVLNYWGVSRTQAQVQSVVRPDGGIIGMTPYGVRSYASTLGLRTLVGVGGSDALVKAMVASGLPIVVHQVVSAGDYTGHWRPIEAYDDAQSAFVCSDPLLGPGYQLAYDTFDRLWAQRDYAFFVIYPPSRQAAVSAAVRAAGWNKVLAFEHDLALVKANQLDVNPTAAPAGLYSAYHYLALAWDEAQLGRSAPARQYLQLAARAGANAGEMRWVQAEISLDVIES